MKKNTIAPDPINESSYPTSSHKAAAPTMHLPPSNSYFSPPPLEKTNFLHALLTLRPPPSNMRATPSIAEEGGPLPFSHNENPRPSFFLPPSPLAPPPRAIAGATAYYPAHTISSFVSRSDAKNNIRTLRSKGNENIVWSSYQRYSGRMNREANSCGGHGIAKECLGPSECRKKFPKYLSDW